MATVVLHLSAIGVALWIGHRRGGLRLLLLSAAVLAVLLRFYGPAILTEPWNPYLPMLWWLVYVLAVWSVVEDDLALLPVAVGAGSICTQTHVSYVGLVAGLGGVAVATVFVRGFRRRHGGPAPARTWAWLAISAAMGAVLWLPPVLEELRRDPGNLSIVFDSFADPARDAIGLRRGAELLVARLDPWRLLFGRADAKVVTEPQPWSVTGLLYLAAWVASMVVAWRLRHRPLLRLHAVLGVALGCGALSASRIYGYTWAWLVQWAWGLTALLAVAVAWTLACAVPRMRPVRLGAAGVVVVLALGSAVGFISDASHVEPDDVASSRNLRHLVPATLEVIDRGVGPGDGRDGRYLITSADPIGVVGNAQAFGLANELDREGIQVGIDISNRLPAAPHLTMDPSQATTVLRLVTGPAIEVWEQKPGTRRIALYDPRTSEERALQARLRNEINEELLRLELPNLVAQIDASLVGSIFVFRTNSRVPDDVIAKLVRIFEIGAPSAVFIES